MLDPIQARKHILKSCRRVVLKVGTRLLADRTAIARLVTQIHALRKSGRQVILVSSGAVGMGMRAAGLKRRPRHLSELSGCEMHLSHLPAQGDAAGLRKLGVNLTSDPKFASRDLFVE